MGGVDLPPLRHTAQMHFAGPPWPRARFAQRVRVHRCRDGAWLWNAPSSGVRGISVGISTLVIAGPRDSTCELVSVLVRLIVQLAADGTTVMAPDRNVVV